MPPAMQLLAAVASHYLSQRSTRQKRFYAAAKEFASVTAALDRAGFHSPTRRRELLRQTPQFQEVLAATHALRRTDTDGTAENGLARSAQSTENIPIQTSAAECDPYLRDKVMMDKLAEWRRQYSIIAESALLATRKKTEHGRVENAIGNRVAWAIQHSGPTTFLQAVDEPVH